MFNLSRTKKLSAKYALEIRKFRAFAGHSFRVSSVSGHGRLISNSSPSSMMDAQSVPPGFISWLKFNPLRWPARVIITIIIIII